MNRFIAHAVAGVLLLAPSWVAFAGETGMSHDDTVNPGAPAPHIAPPGGSTSLRPLSTNTTPRTGATPLPSGLPPREVQPGEETPQAEDQTRGQIKRPLPGTAGQSGGGDGTQTEDELYVGRKAGGGQVSSGDEDEFEDLQVERRTVQGAEKPGVPSQGPSAGPGGQGVGLPPRRKEGPMARGAPTPGAPAPGADVTASKRGPNCGTFWTTRVEDPEVNVNPCPKNCTRGERQLVNTYKQGNKTLYDARYQCYQMATVPQSKGGAALTPDNSPPARARAVIEKPAAVPAGTVTPASGPWGTFARLKGPRFGSADSVRALWYPNDDTTKAPTLSQSATIYRRHGTDEIEIQLPRDPAKSGFSGGVGNFSSGPLHILLFMPDEKTVIYAGRYTVDTGIVRKGLRKKAGAEVAVKPTTSTQPPLDLPTLPGGLGVDAAKPITENNDFKKPEGEPIVNLKVEQSDSPGFARITWTKSRVAGVRYDVYSATEVDSWILVDSNGYQPVSYVGSLDSAKTYKFAVVARYPDGRIARAETGPYQAQAPKAPEWVHATQIDDDTVMVIWPAVWEFPEKFNCNRERTVCQQIENITYVIAGQSDGDWREVRAAKTNLNVGQNLIPPEKQQTYPKYRSIEYKGLARGPHRFSVGARYSGNEQLPASEWPWAEVTVGEFSNNYRVSVQGIEVHQETEDDPWERDGKRDEIFILAQTCLNDKCSYPQSGVFGDINGHSDRIKAGSASPDGGIRGGDYLGLRPIEHGTPSTTGLPFLLWEGRLRNIWDRLSITPGLWEEDLGAKRSAASVYSGFTHGGKFIEAEGLGFGKLMIGSMVGNDGRHCVIYTCGHDPKGEETRAIGLVAKRWEDDLTIASQVRAGGEIPLGLADLGYEVPCKILLLTREKIEAGLGALSSQVISLDLNDALSGHYTMYFKVERLP